MINVVIAYDVSNDDNRAHLAAALSRHGVRLQRSVFYCQLDDEDALHKLIGIATGIANPNTDTVHVFHQCDACAGRRHTWGQARPMIDTPYWVV